MNNEIECFDWIAKERSETQIVDNIQMLLDSGYRVLVKLKCEVLSNKFKEYTYDRYNKEHKEGVR